MTKVLITGVAGGRGRLVARRLLQQPRRYRVSGIDRESWARHPEGLRFHQLDVRKKGYALADQEAEIGIRSIAVPLVRFDGKVVAALNIGVQPEQVSAKTMIADYLPLLVKETTALKERLV